MSSDDSSALRPIGPWDALWRGSFSVEHGGLEYVVDVDYFDLKERINLYQSGVRVEVHASPARFEIDAHTSIEAAMSLYGMKYVDLVTADGGVRRAFTPRAGTGEAWRARLARDHPVLSRWIGTASWSVLVFAAIAQLPVIYNSTLAHFTGVLVPTFGFPEGVNAALGVAGILAALDRALSVKHSKWLDS